MFLVCGNLVLPMPVSACMYAPVFGARGEIGPQLYTLNFETGLFSSLELIWLASEPKDPPVSASLVLGLQVTNHAWHFTLVLGSELRFSCLCGGYFTN